MVTGETTGSNKSRKSSLRKPCNPEGSIIIDATS